MYSLSTLHSEKLVTYTSHKVLKDSAMGWTRKSKGKDKCVDSFGGKKYWKVATWKTEDEMEGQHEDDF